MLLLHQSGTVKIGEVIRYTITYTPSHDRILPSPTSLYLRIKNTSAIALRAAFVHGPYTLSVSAYPADYRTDARWDRDRVRDRGVPEFEPNLKAGGAWACELRVPESIRAQAGNGGPSLSAPAGLDNTGQSGGASGPGDATVEQSHNNGSVSWIVEVASQVIFSNSASVHYEIMLGRDEKSLSLGGFGTSSLTMGTPLEGRQQQPGQVSDHQQSSGGGGRDGHAHAHGHHDAQAKGVFSKAIKVRVDDTASLWNTPKLPEWEEGRLRVRRLSSLKGKSHAAEKEANDGEQLVDGQRQKRQKKVHLVVLTHGLHSNLGADMLYLKESIDAAARQAKIDARARRKKMRVDERQRAEKAAKSPEDCHAGERKNDKGDTEHPAEQREDDLDESEDEEEVIVRGFSGNAVRTERGIKYLGKRLARYVLAMTYPDQPYKPTTKKVAAENLSHALRPDDTHVTHVDDASASHKHSTIHKEPYPDAKSAYKITSISFIAHSLGGLVQTYAVAYIQKHSPEFFDKIKPINFIAMASPFLGLSNENPLYVKFALDFGLVGRTGQDLGLTWRAPTLARSGWGAIVGGISETAQRKIDGDNPPESKPLLRILPTGPAHVVLKKFRNRTVYSNVVNDGIVPLRTSCLLFLDWQGLGRVEKARRENGLVGTMAGWGWAELTGANSSSPARKTFPESAASGDEDTGTNTPTRTGHGEEVPQPPADATVDDDAQSLKSPGLSPLPAGNGEMTSTGETTNQGGPLASIMKFFQPASASNPKPQAHTTKQPKIYKRSQTIRMGNDDSTQSLTSPTGPGKATTGDAEHSDPSLLSAPPKTTFFESAGDLLKPPLPSVEFLIDPSSRPRTIFHDRVYHPGDIPPPPLKKRPMGLLRRRSSITTASSSARSRAPTDLTLPLPHTDSTLSARDYDDTKNTNPDKDPREVIDGSAMKVEEKIARAYHRDLSWRKVLVRLEPDAHNNMIVRRMFANAYGWPVIKHLCDTHFSDNAVSLMRDEDESRGERAKAANERPGREGGEVIDSSPHNTSPLCQEGERKGEAIKKIKKEDRTNSEVREATDEISTLGMQQIQMQAPKRQGTGGSGGSGSSTSNKGLGAPAQHSRRGSDVGGAGAAGYRSESEAAWSERDWADSEADSEDDGDVDAGSGSGSGSSGNVLGKKWNLNWTEAIAGKGSSSAIPKSPRSPTRKGTEGSEVEAFLAGRSK